jgi:arylsulfatase A-like enzyme
VALGEHGFTGKPYNALWPELTDIPFLIRSPDGKGGGETSDYYASTHDVAPTILGALGLLPPQQMDGQYLTLLMGDGEPTPRDHFTLGYNQFVSTRDDKYAMISVNDRSDAKLYDIQRDPGMNDDIAADNRDVVDRMFDDYVLKDAGGPLPRVPS